MSCSKSAKWKWKEASVYNRTMSKGDLKIQHERLQKTQAEASNWSSQCPDLNMTENLWLEFKHAVSAGLSKDISELEVTCRKNGWKKRLLAGYKCLQAVISAKGVVTKCWLVFFMQELCFLLLNSKTNKTFNLSQTFAYNCALTRYWTDFKTGQATEAEISSLLVLSVSPSTGSTGKIICCACREFNNEPSRCSSY